MNKKRFYESMLTIIMVSMLCVVFASCSSDDEVIPKITVPNGTENYFSKSMDFDSPASEKNLTFTTNVPWTISVSETRNGISWLSVSPTNGDAGTHTVTIKAVENTTFDDRNAVISVAAGDSIQKVFVNQKQKDALTLTADRFEVPVTGGTIDIEVKANVDYQAIIPNEYKGWIHKKNNATRGLSTSKLSFSIDESKEYDKREGKIRIKSAEKEETVTIYQTGGGILTLTQNEYSISNSAQELSIEINSNFEYSVELPAVDWIKENTSNTRGMSTHTLRLKIEENAGYDGRSAKVRIYDKNSLLSEEVIINQGQKDALIINKKQFEFDENGGEFSVEVNSNVNYQIGFNCDWITETTTATRGLKASNHTFSVSAITDNSDREGTIFFIDALTGISEKVIVKQNRAIYFDSNTLTLMEGSEKNIKLINNTNQNVTWKSSNPSIVSVDDTGKAKAQSKGRATITVTTADGCHICKCEIIVQDITDCISMARTGTGMTVSMYGTRYSVTFTIRNTSPETIHIVSLAGVTNGVDQDLRGGESVDITIASSTAAIQTYQQTLIYTYNGKQYSLKG
jgi:hypothetical protein